MTQPKAPRVEMGKVYCPICTHTVDAWIEHHPRQVYVKPGQKCPRCHGSLDAGVIMHIPDAA
jgi:hypothetical protein